jgi:hypothetical protein
MLCIRRLVFLVALLVPGMTSADTYLLMAEEPGCMWCARWNREIAHIYPKTEVGQTAPLRRFNLHDGQPSDVTFERKVHFTPTFILVQDGVEVGRMEGYGGDEFFWSLLEMMFDKAGIAPETAG